MGASALYGGAANRFLPPLCDKTLWSYMDPTAPPPSLPVGVKVRYMKRRKIFQRLRPVTREDREMAESVIVGQLENFVTSLKNQGTLDECFDALLKLKDDHNPQSILETITLFFKETDNIKYEIYKAVNNNPVEYSKVASCAHNLKGKSASVGCCKMASACEELEQAGEDENMEGSNDAYRKVKCEYEELRIGLGVISRMERNIIAIRYGGGRASSFR